MDNLHALNMAYLHHLKWFGIGYAIFLFITGFILAKWMSYLIGIASAKHFSKHHTLLAKRICYYVIFMAFTISSLQHLGFNLSVLVGAAGLFTVAISFASQTAASNLVSGIFLLIERPFKVGDQIEIKSITGTVEAIDLLSTKIKTSDNRLVRIPNESLIKSEITNLSYFSIRRADIYITVTYNCDIEHIKLLLLQAASNNPLVLDDPAAQLIINRFAETGVELRLMVWTKSDEVSLVMTSVRNDIKLAFDKENITMPNVPVSLVR